LTRRRFFPRRAPSAFYDPGRPTPQRSPSDLRRS
jgi:hypothetical protein